MRATIIGGNGFIGRHLVRKLEGMGIEVFIPERNDPLLFQIDLGVVFYCAGTTSDFRRRPYDTMNAHISYLSSVLEHSTFDTLVYLSSTRVYYHSEEAQVDSPVTVFPLYPDDLFNISKLAGESICFAAPRPGIKVIRISNVCGDDFDSNNFLYSIIKDAVHKGHITLRSSMDSEKDYIFIDDVVNLILLIAQHGKQQIYNVASGYNLTNRTIVDFIRNRTGCSVSIVENPEAYRFPKIDISQTLSEFSYQPQTADKWLDQLIIDYMNRNEIYP